MAITIKRMGARQQGLDSGRTRRILSPPQETYVKVATVGHRDRNPAYARIEESQVWIEVTIQPDGDEVVARLALPSADQGAGAYFPVEPGCRVIVDFPDGDPNDPVVVGRLHDAACKMPATVAGLATGASLAVAPDVSAPAPNFAFIRTRTGQLLAIESGDGGDILHHAGGSIELRAGAIHLDGTVHLGEAFGTPPVPGQVAPGNATTSATPAVPHAPTPVTAAQNPLASAQGNPADAIVRLKDAVTSNSAIDATFWAWVANISAIMVPLAAAWAATQPTGGTVVAPASTPLPPLAVTPTAMGSRHDTAGARHTASD